MPTIRPYVTMLILALLTVGPFSFGETMFPDAHWTEATPDSVGLDQRKLDAVRDFMGGRGCVVRHGKLVYSWGDIGKRGDVASALKPVVSFLLFKAVELGKLESVDVPVMQYEPRLNDLNAALDYKDRAITFRHMANQYSCYGAKEAPGTAFNYNDFQMALLIDTLVQKVYGVPMEQVDSELLHPLLTDVLKCEDNPTMLAFGIDNRPGRLAISPRDFARIGLLYLNKGTWDKTVVISAENVRTLTSSPLPGDLPVITGEVAEMIPDQRSAGHLGKPGLTEDHGGSYSWLWWVNGVNRNGKRKWPAAPLDVFAALGHENGQRGIAVIPSLDIVLSWNDTRLGDLPNTPEEPINEVLRLLQEALK